MTPKKSRCQKAEWKKQFLANLSKTGNVRASCEKAGISREAAYHNREQDQAFAAQWAAALEEAIERLEEIARKRAESTSDTLLIFLLKSHRPEKYRERYEVKQTGTVQLELVEEIVESHNHQEGAAP